MTTLITGAGLIGCQTAAILAGRGEPVVLLDLDPVAERIATVVPLKTVRVLAGDIRDRQAIIDLIRAYRIRKVVHTAAALSMSIRREPTLAADVNVVGTINLLEAARTSGLERLVFASSTTVYYPIFRRAHSSPIAEDFVLHSVSERPGSLYAASKLASEFFLQHYADQFSLSIAILRYSAVLGLWAGPNYSVPGRLMAELLGEGSVDRRIEIRDPLLMWSGGEDFIDARDVARANVAALDATGSSARVFNIASGRMSRFTDFVEAARRVSPALNIQYAPIPETGFAGFAYPREVPFDVSLARSALGFEAQHSLDDSFHAAQVWVKKH